MSVCVWDFIVNKQIFTPLLRGIANGKSASLPICRDKRDNRVNTFTEQRTQLKGVSLCVRIFVLKCIRRKVLK